MFQCSSSMKRLMLEEAAGQEGGGISDHFAVTAQVSCLSVCLSFKLCFIHVFTVAI